MRLSRILKRDHRPHGPALLEWPLSVEEVAQHRNLTCGLYTICLDVVVRRQWVSFTCRPCSLWSQAPAERVTAGPATVLPMVQPGRL